MSPRLNAAVKIGCLVAGIGAALSPFTYGISLLVGVLAASAHALERPARAIAQAALWHGEAEVPAGPGTAAWLQAQPLETMEAARPPAVPVDAMMVRVLAGEEGSPARAAQRVAGTRRHPAARDPSRRLAGDDAHGGRRRITGSAGGLARSCFYF